MGLVPDSDHVLVRMYNVGFGDAFLMVFPAPDRPRRVLVDCGSHASGPGPRPMAEVVKQIVEDVTDDDGTPRIDVVVGTHRHRDHVSGFADAQWRRVEVREVWMPWTENPRDPLATRIRERQSALALALDRAGLDASGTWLAKNALTNASAMEMLHHGFSGDPERKFLPAAADDGDGDDGDDGGDGVVQELECESLGAARIRVEVLGPARDEVTIRDMDPPAGAGYLRMATGAQSASSPEKSLFGDDWEVSAKDLASDPQLKSLLLTSPERSIVNAAAREDPFGVAVALEKAVNGTSLVLLFTLGDARLLFPGDAQWGTWKRILESSDAKGRLEGTTFVKVGHHGSHNATPRAFVELLAAEHPDGAGGAHDLWAMVSTRPIAIWKQIPKPELMQALHDVTSQLARSDAGGGSPSPGFGDWTETHIDAEVPLVSRVRERNP